MVQQEAKVLGEKVRDARRRLGLDQKAVAFAANVSPRTVFAIEKGKATVRFDMLMRVLAAVGLRLTAEGRDRAWRPRALRDE
jgi:y4mF family transcriptional regulator